MIKKICKMCEAIFVVRCYEYLIIETTDCSRVFLLCRLHLLYFVYNKKTVVSLFFMHFAAH